VREAGYQSVEEKISVEPDAVQTLRISLAKDPGAQYPTVSAEVKLAIDPDRAAVFVDDQFAGHAHEFGGAGRAMLLSPASTASRSLAGYQSFDTEIEVRANQKYDIKTQLPKGTKATKSRRLSQRGQRRLHAYAEVVRRGGKCPQLERRLARDPHWLRRLQVLSADARRKNWSKHLRKNP